MNNETMNETRLSFLTKNTDGTEDEVIHRHTHKSRAHMAEFQAAVSEGYFGKGGTLDRLRSAKAEG